MRINFTPPNNEKINANNAEANAPEVAETVEEGAEKVSQRPPARAAIDRAVNIEEVIKAFKLPDTPAVRNLIAAMARGGVELSFDNIDILSQASEAFSELKADQIVFMAREGITINSENVERFQQFLTHKNLIGEQLAHILEQLPEQPPQNAASPQRPAATVSNEAGLSQMILENSSGKADPPVLPAAVPDAPATDSPQAAQTRPAVQQNNAPTGGSQLPINAPVAPNVSAEPNVTAPPDAVTVPAQTGGDAQAVQAQPAVLPDATMITEAPMPTASSEAPATQNTSGVPAAPADAQPSPQPATNVDQPPAADNAQSAQARPAAPQNNAAQIPVQGRGVPAAPNAAAHLSAAIQEQAQTVEQKLASLFRKVDPNNPHKLSSELNARELARELSEVIDAIKQRLPEMETQSREALTRSVTELEQSVKFLDNLNRFTPILNIPLQWGDERTTAELYVFNDSRGKKIDPQNATVFISLMTSNAGRVETMIKVLGKSVECDFSLETEETADAVRGGMHTLYKLLDVQGYRLARTSAQTAEKAKDIFDVSKVREQNKSRYFFDRKV